MDANSFHIFLEQTHFVEHHSSHHIILLLFLGHFAAERTNGEKVTLYQAPGILV